LQLFEGGGDGDGASAGLVVSLPAGGIAPLHLPGHFPLEEMALLQKKQGWQTLPLSPALLQKLPPSQFWCFLQETSLVGALVDVGGKVVPSVGASVATVKPLHLSGQLFLRQPLLLQALQAVQKPVLEQYSAAGPGPAQTLCLLHRRGPAGGGGGGLPEDFVVVVFVVVVVVAAVDPALPLDDTHVPPHPSLCPTLFPAQEHVGKFGSQFRIFTVKSCVRNTRPSVDHANPQCASLNVLLLIVSQ